MATPLPILDFGPGDEADDTQVVDIPRTCTRVYDLTLRAPAAPLWERFPLTAAVLADPKTPVDLVSASLAAGCRWRVGPLFEARSHTVIWLLPLDIPAEKQVAAWWIGGPA